MVSKAKLWAQIAGEARAVREVTLAAMGLDSAEVDVLLFDPRGVLLTWRNKNRKAIYIPYDAED